MALQPGERKLFNSLDPPFLKSIKLEVAVSYPTVRATGPEITGMWIDIIYGDTAAL